MIWVIARQLHRQPGAIKVNPFGYDVIFRTYFVSDQGSIYRSDPPVIRW